MLVPVFGDNYTTVMSVDFGVDMEKVREFLKRKSEKRRLLLDEQYERANRDFDRIVARVIDELNPLRIYQWGSLLDRRRISEISDIDIAVEGLNGPEGFFKNCQNRHGYNIVSCGCR